LADIERARFNIKSSNLFVGAISCSPLQTMINYTGYFGRCWPTTYGQNEEEIKPYISLTIHQFIIACFVEKQSHVRCKNKAGLSAEKQRLYK